MNDARPKIRKQCKACPWRRGVVPARDIPGGYCEMKHAALTSTIATPGVFDPSNELRMMACHESPLGREKPCVGWTLHQLNEGNNIALRILARDGRFAGYRTVGPQCTSFDETIRQNE